MSVFGSKLYVVAGEVSGKTEYLNFDSASGGYPYSSTAIRDKTANLQKAVDWVEEAKKYYTSMSNPKVYEILLQETDVTGLMTDGKIVNDLLKTLTTEQKKLLKDKLK
jgi:glyoxylate utilization-related uncharacterized protein